MRLRHLPGLRFAPALHCHYMCRRGALLRLVKVFDDPSSGP